ncbi:MAG: iron dependent repressor, metal binding and dimerization domain protein, partial [Anaerolineales bacterium]
MEIWIVLIPVVVVLIVAAVQIRSWWRRRRRRLMRVMGEDVLKQIYNATACDQDVSLETVSDKLRIRPQRAQLLLEILHEQGLLLLEAGRLRLTDSGERYALHIIRAHRLWEHYLAEETGYPETEWHGRAERREHFLQPEETHALSAKLGHPTHDPHGHPIPTHEGEFVAIQGEPISSIPPDIVAHIVRIEDQPECVYAQLVEDGLYPGMEVKVLESSHQGVRFLAEGVEHWLPPIPAANVSVVAEEEPKEAVPLGISLSMLEP